MTCKRTQIDDQTVMWVCSIDGMAYYEWRSQQDEIEHEFQQAKADLEELPERESDMFYAREDIDPYWPPDNVRPTEAADVEYVPL